MRKLISFTSHGFVCYCTGFLLNIFVIGTKTDEYGKLCFIVLFVLWLTLCLLKCALLTCFSRELDLPASAVDKARCRNFEIAGYVIDAPSEPLRAPHLVRVGLIQNKIVLPTTDPVQKQVGCIFEHYFERICFICNLYRCHCPVHFMSGRC